MDTEQKLTLPKLQEKIVAQLHHYLDPSLQKAGHDERASFTIILVTANRCCAAGANNIEFAGYNPASQQVIVQTNDKHHTVCVDAAKASKEDPIEQLHALQAEMKEMKARQEATDKELQALKASNQEKEKAAAQAKPAAAGEEKKESGGFFQWLGKAIDTVREKLQTFAKEFMERPFEAIGKCIDAALNVFSHDKSHAAPTQATPEPAVQAAASKGISH